MKKPAKKNKPGQGRKPGPVKVSVTLKLLPATKAALQATGDMGAAVDAAFSKYPTTGCSWQAAYYQRQNARA